jgi:hypothetical protein
LISASHLKTDNELVYPFHFKYSAMRLLTVFVSVDCKGKMMLLS